MVQGQSVKKQLVNRYIDARVTWFYANTHRYLVEHELDDAVR